MAKFVIVDPSLKDVRGHHYALSKRISDAATALGHEVVWLCHRGASFSTVEHVDLAPTFSVSLYDAYKDAPSLVSPGARLEAFIRRIFERVTGRFRAARSTQQQQVEALARQLKAANKTLNLSEDDRLLFHTADGMTYAFIDNTYRGMPDAKVPKMHIATPYDPAGIMPNRVPEAAIDATIQAWDRRGWLDHKIFLYGENDRLSEHLAREWSVTVRSLPLPVPADTELADPAKVRWPEGARLKMVMLGPARVEKGFHLLPEIVRHTVEKLRLDPDDGQFPISFVFQASPQIVGYVPEVLKAIEALRQYPKNLVRLIEDTLGEEDYLGLVTSADLVLMPYGMREYRFRSSGIVTEAISLNKIIIASRDTYPGSIVGVESGLAVPVEPEAFADAIVEVLSDLPRYHADAIVRGDTYRSRCSAAMYVRRCVAREQGQGLAPEGPSL